LNGLEIIDDLCGIIAEKLRTDCNLREQDGYSSGYKAKFTLHLECFGFDTATVDYEISVNETAKVAVDQVPDELIDLEVEIPQETDLSLVRERSGQAEPTIEITPEGPVDAPRPRKYSRRLKALDLIGAAQGGATGPVEE
jgi:hypothetical protein